MAVKAPAVRDLQKLIATQQAALKPQLGFIDDSIAANDKSGAAQEAGLAATQKTAFGQIEQAAQNKGMSFSGFTPNEEAGYTANTYLPKLAELQSTIANTRNSLLGKKIDLNKGAFDTATNQRENDRSVLADWNKMTAEQRFNASESKKQRAFTAHQNELQRQADASNRAAADAGISPADKKVQDIAAFAGSLSSVAGADSFVHQNSYAQSKALWKAMGYGSKEFDKQFSSYRNPKNKQYKLG